MILETIAIALLIWLFIGACALPFIARFFYMDDEGEA